MRYNPDTDTLTLDSKEPDFTNYDAVFRKELRYKNLEVKNKDEYEMVLEGKLVCNSAGTMNDPWKLYDITVLL